MHFYYLDNKVKVTVQQNYLWKTGRKWLHNPHAFIYCTMISQCSFRRTIFYFELWRLTLFITLVNWKSQLIRYKSCHVFWYRQMDSWKWNTMQDTEHADRNCSGLKTIKHKNILGWCTYSLNKWQNDIKVLYSLILLWTPSEKYLMEIYN